VAAYGDTIEPATFASGRDHGDSLGAGPGPGAGRAPTSLIGDGRGPLGATPGDVVGIGDAGDGRSPEMTGAGTVADDSTSENTGAGAVGAIAGTSSGGGAGRALGRLGAMPGDVVGIGDAVDASDGGGEGDCDCDPTCIDAGCAGSDGCEACIAAGCCGAASAGCIGAGCFGCGATPGSVVIGAICFG